MAGYDSRFQSALVPGVFSSTTPASGGMTLGGHMASAMTSGLSASGFAGLSTVHRDTRSGSYWNVYDSTGHQTHHLSIHPGGSGMPATVAGAVHTRADTGPGFARITPAPVYAGPGVAFSAVPGYSGPIPSYAAPPPAYASAAAAAASAGFPPAYGAAAGGAGAPPPTYTMSFSAVPSVGLPHAPGSAGLAFTHAAAHVLTSHSGFYARRGGGGFIGIINIMIGIKDTKSDEIINIIFIDKILDGTQDLKDFSKENLLNLEVLEQQNLKLYQKKLSDITLTKDQFKSVIDEILNFIGSFLICASVLIEYTPSFVILNEKGEDDSSKLKGGSYEKYYSKYLKYKQKYLDAKN